MEYINKIELLGKVGTVRSNVVNGTKVANFSLVTDFLYKTRDGNPVSEATWFNIVAWEGKDNLNMEQIAEELHFSTTPYFCRFFKREVGFTPTQYREK